MKKENFIILIFTVLMFPGKIISLPWSVSISPGVIRTTQPDVSDLNIYTFSPEIQIERNLFNITKDINWISGAMYFSWWDDFVNEPTSLMDDYVTYSHQFSVIGTRLLLNSRPWNIYFSIFGGISQNYIKSKYIGGSSWGGGIGEDHKRNKILYNYGINIGYPIFSNISIGMGGIYEFTTKNDFMVNPRLGFKINIRYDI